jgi:hypothetical protein
VSQLGHTERVFIASLSPAGFGNRRAARGRSSGIRSSGPDPAPKTQLKLLLRVESPRGKKKEASDRSSPHHGARLLISLPVERQLLELKPSGSKFGNSDIRPRRDAGEWSVVGPIPWSPDAGTLRIRVRRRAGGGLACAVATVTHPTPLRFGPWPLLDFDCAPIRLIPSSLNPVCLLG